MEKLEHLCCIMNIVNNDLVARLLRIGGLNLND